MEIFKNYSYLLRFRIKQNVLSTYHTRWGKVKSICEMGAKKKMVVCRMCNHTQSEYLGDGENTEDIVRQWKEYCRLETNRNLLYLDTFEGGMYNPLRPACRLLFRSTNNRRITDNDNDIVIEIVNLPNDKESWTYPELDDLREAFIQMIIIKIGIVVESCIEMNWVNNNIFNTYDYIDDSSDSSEYGEEFESSICL